MAVKITIDKHAVKVKIKGHWDGNVQAPLTEQIAKDSNFYCREDTGELIDSSLRASDFKAGLIIWDKPYAQRVFHIGTPSKDVNPNASLQWPEKARKAKGKQWEKFAQGRWDR